MIRKIILLLQILHVARFGNSTDLPETRNLRHGFEFSVDYSDSGKNWGAVVPGAELCGTGLEQSPININLSESTNNKRLEQNGYGYSDYILSKDMIKMPNF